MQLSSINWLQPVMIAVVCVIMLYLFLRWFERANVWMPRKNVEADPSLAGMPFEDLVLTTPDHVKIHAWYIPHDEARGSLLFCHGNGGNIGHRLESIRQFRLLQLNVLIFDYRGYGKSGGWLSEEGTYTDAETAYHWLKQKTPDLPMVMFGRSMGAAIATELAARIQVDALIFESGFTSIADIGKDLFPFLPIQWFSSIRYDSLSKMKGIHTPLLVLHGKADDIVPYLHGRNIFENANEPKEFIHLPGGHNDGHFIEEEEYLSNLHAFLERSVFTKNETDSPEK